MPRFVNLDTGITYLLSQLRCRKTYKVLKPAVFLAPLASPFSVLASRCRLAASPEDEPAVASGKRHA